MKKDDIIQNLTNVNQELTKEVQLWKSKYQKLEQAYNQLVSINNFDSTQSNIDLFVQFNSQPPLESFENSLASTPQQIQVNFNRKALNSPQRQKLQKNLSNILKPNQDIFDFFSDQFCINQAGTKATNELIQGSFIIQKNSSIDHYDPLKFVHPSQKFNKLKHMFDIIYRFIFIDEKIPEIEDDEFDSRKNQINFGDPCEDFQFVFDNLNEKDSNKNGLNQFQKITHLMKKRYIYGVVRPEIVSIGEQSFETELAYGFISNVPFPNFFKDLNRIVQQQLKFRMLNMKKNIVDKKQKVDILSDIIKDITSKSLQRKLQVTGYPINLQLNANVCGLRLVYNNKNNYISDQFNYIESFAHRFSKLKLIKILHYVLTEQHIILICKNRRNLNQLFQIIRSIIYPFNWVFPIIYYYSPFFQPFISSPLPILIGFIESQFQQGNQKTQKNIILPANDFIKIYAQEQQRQDVNEIDSFKQRIKKVHKFLSKLQPKRKTQANMSPLLQKSSQERVTIQFYNYIKKLRKFIQTGKINEEIDDFHIQFMETQMVSYYKQNLVEETTK